MKCDKSIVICGGDKRQKYLYELMVEKGLDVSTFALERDGDIKELTNYDVVILPVPVTKDAATGSTRNFSAPRSSDDSPKRPIGVASRIF